MKKKAKRKARKYYESEYKLNYKVEYLPDRQYVLTCNDQKVLRGEWGTLYDQRYPNATSYSIREVTNLIVAEYYNIAKH